MWIVPVSSSLDNRDKTILKKLTLIQDLQYNCHKAGFPLGLAM